MTSASRIPPREFEALVEEALAAVPERFRRYLENVVVVVEEEPSDEDFDETDTPDDHELFGIFRGAPYFERQRFVSDLPAQIAVFRGPILRSATPSCTSSGICSASGTRRCRTDALVIPRSEAISRERSLASLGMTVWGSADPDRFFQSERDRAAGVDREIEIARYGRRSSPDRGARRRSLQRGLGVVTQHLPEDGSHRGPSRDVLDVVLRMGLADSLVGRGPDRNRASARLELR